MKTEEKRIYVAVAATIKTPRGTITQPLGRQAAQACHVTNALRSFIDKPFRERTTIILQVRDTAELEHVYNLATESRAISDCCCFNDENPEYGPGRFKTAIVALATPVEIAGIFDYLPLWPVLK